MSDDPYDRVRRAAEDAGHFDVTDVHLALLRRAYVEWNYSQAGAPMIDPKRPYGDKRPLETVAELADPAAFAAGAGGFSENWLDLHWEWLETIHAETAIALEIILNTGQMAAGRYIRRDYRTWEPVNTDD